MIGRNGRKPTRRVVALTVAGVAALVAFAFAPHDVALLAPTPAEAVVNGPTVSVFAGGGLSLVDSPGHSAVLAVREDPDNHNDAIIASAPGASEHLNVGAGCKYLSQTDFDPTNDTAPGYDLWVRCANVTGAWALVLDDGADQVSVSHPTRTTLGAGKNVTLLAGAGNDTISILDGSAEVYGEGDNDTIRGGPYDDILHGGPGFDKLISRRGKGPAHDVLYGDAGNDTLIGGRSSDVLDGGSGLDVISPGGARDTINGRDGEADEINCGGDDLVADALHFDPGVDKTFHCAAEIRRNPGGA
jgi:Ca2+-binding RTX toxin-like protein